MHPNLHPGCIDLPRRTSYRVGKRRNGLKKIRILLANRPPMLLEIMRVLVQRQEDMEVVGEVLDPIGLLVAVREWEANAVILTLEGYEEPGLCSHLVTEYPNLTILALAADGKTAFLRPPRREIKVPSEQSIVDALRDAVRVKEEVGHGQNQ